MREDRGNLWDFWDAGEWVAITTNGAVRKDGRLVMGRGCAREARDRFPNVDKVLGGLVLRRGNVPHVEHGARIVTFPVKHHWRERADLDLIRASATALARTWFDDRRLYIPRPGCGNGGLRWEDVKPVLEPILDDHFVVVTFA